MKTMKRVLLLTSLAVFLAGTAAAQVARGNTAYVTVKTIQVKSSTGFFAGNRGTLSYGAQVTVLQVNGKWAEIRSAGAPSITGWLDSSNLTTRRISAASGGTRVSAGEVALAGKGFSAEIENAYKDGNNLNYADVDKIETLGVSQEDLYKFVTEGRLTPGDN